MYSTVEVIRDTLLSKVDKKDQLSVKAPAELSISKCHEIYSLAVMRRHNRVVNQVL